MLNNNSRSEVSAQNSNQKAQSQTAVSPQPAADTTDPSYQKAAQCARACLDKKAENVKVIHLAKAGGFTDYFVICSATSDRQVQAIADSVTSTMKKSGMAPIASEGYTGGRWVLIDFGDVIVHIFLDALRDYYDLENLWSYASVVRFTDEPARQS